MIKYLNKENDWKDSVKEKTLVDFYADWCGPCKMLGNILEKLEEENPNINILKVNTDEFSNLSMSMGVMSIPALFLMENGEIKKKHVGLLSKEELIKFIEE